MDARLAAVCDEKIERVRRLFREMSEEKRKEAEERDYMAVIEGEVLSSKDLSLDEAREMISLIYRKTRSKLGPITDLVRDPNVSEIMVNGPGRVFSERHGRIELTDVTFSSKEELEEVIRNIAASVHREVSEMNPVLDARLENGSRVNAVMGNIVAGGPALTIRKFAKKRITMDDMADSGALTTECRDALKELVETGHNILISGGTSSGKTTFLDALTDYIPKGERVIVIEDSRELMLDNIDNIVQMECHGANSQGEGEITMDTLIRSSLRMRPDRIIVGEVRGKEVAMMLQAMNTGHDGSITTGHGNSPAGMLRRLEAMYLMTEEIPLEAIRAQILEGIDILIHLSRMKDGTRKVLEVSELTGFRNGNYELNRLFCLGKSGKLERTGRKLRSRVKLELGKR